jgi:diguanylate cyclase (GGDEF)-like protein
MSGMAILRRNREGACEPAPAPPAALEAGPDATARPVKQQELVASLGVKALRTESLEELMRHACSAAASALDASHAAVFEHVVVDELLVGRVGHGWGQQSLRSTLLSVAQSHAGAALSTGEPVLVAEWSTETRFPAAELLGARQFASALAVPILGATSSYGVLDVQSVAPRAFDLQDVYMLQGIANVIALAIARARSEERIRHQGMHDMLTGLPNRTLFEDRMAQALAAARRHRRTVAILFVDIDDFKRVNDMLGHAGGDELLREVARRLEGCIRSSDTLARFGGDEFAILLHEADGVMAARSVAQRVLEALEAPIVAGERRLSMSASIGIALGGGYDSGMPNELVRNADLAMYAAKDQGKARAELYAPQMYDAARRRIEMISDLDRALANDEFVVHYQPIVALRDRRVAGVEALVRWNHPTQGLLSPAQFLPLAAETEQIAAISRIVLCKACVHARRWQASDPALAQLTLSVNLAAQQIKAHDLVPAVRAALEEAELAPAHLVLEVTEHVLVSDDNDVIGQLRSLKRLGARIAVDDFGTGYSALSYLQRFPIDFLKIDKSFVDALGESHESELLVEGIINLAHVLNLETIAEGIETLEQERRLREMGSELAQGYLFAKPLAAAAMDEFLREPAAGAAAVT